MKVAREVVEVLKSRGIQPSAQRVAVAQHILDAHDHPCADEVFARVKKRFPMVSRATVYNTLNVLVDKGLLRALVLAESKVVFDPKIEPHHHFIDEATGTIHDVPWDALRVSDVGSLPGLDVREYQVVLRGRRRTTAR